MADPLAVLKVNELLKEVRVDYTRTAEAAEAGIAALRSCLLQIPEQEVGASLAASFVQDLGVPAAKANFKFRRPDVVEVVGSFATQTVAKPVQNIDLAIRMPKSCFHEKDFLNHRYHAKRALYLAVIRKQLTGCPAVRNSEWTLLHHDARKPVLLVHLAVDKFDPNTNFDIHVLPTIAPDVFEVSKLAPGRNNVREASSGVGIGATPYYNSSILEDMSMQDHCSFLEKAISQLDALREAILLSKVWMRQRGFAAAPDSLNGFLMSMLLAHLSTDAGGRKITSNMTGFQIFRICMEAIANGNVLGKGLYLQQNNTKIDYSVSQTFVQFFDVSMFDPSGYHNMAFRLTKDALQEIKEEASRTIAAMKGSRDHGFDQVFMTAADFATKFDYHVRICAANYIDSNSNPPCFIDEDNCRLFERQVESALSRGLRDRACLIRILRRSLPSGWTIDQGACGCRKLPVFVGINASNFETACRMVDVGPSADNKDEATKFREFWGEKAELRRFKDGTITETAVWECEPWQRHLIIPKIVEHVLSRHLSLSNYDIHVVAGQLDFTLLEGKKDLVALIPKLLEAIEALSKRLRNLDDLPLKISSVQPLSAAFRHAAVFPPEIHPLADERRAETYPHKAVASCIDPLEVMVQLEGSGRWPSNETAVEKTKVAFCLKIAESMQRLYGVRCVAAEDSVDLLMYGFSFRLKIYYEKDSTLVKQRFDQPLHLTKEISPGHDQINGLSPSLEDDLLLRSLHSSMLSGLQGRYPIYGPTVRLAKRWIGCHLFSGVLQDEAIELVVAYLFLRPAPFSTPSSRITGFLRFLQLLVNHDWALSPLIVDVNGDLTSKEVNSILDEFHSVRNLQPLNGSSRKDKKEGRAMFIATPYDMKSLSWTMSSPSSLTLKRLVAYARTSADLLSQLIRGEMQERWQSLFRTPLHLYDILLKIERSKLPHPSRVLFPAEIEAKESVIARPSNDDSMDWLPASALKHGLCEAQKQLLIGFDPTQCFLQDLKLKFGNLFSFWYDSNGSEVIGLTWNGLEIQSTKTSVNKRKRVENDLAVPDELIELVELGEGFVKSAHLLASPSQQAQVL